MQATKTPERIAGVSAQSVPILGKKARHKLERELVDPDSPEATPFDSADEALTHAAGVMVFSCYPDWPWRVYADHAQGVVCIQLQFLMGENDYIVIPIKLLTHEKALYTHVMQQCGELLERFGLPRGPYNSDKFLEALGRIPVHRRRKGMIPK